MIAQLGYGKLERMRRLQATATLAVLILTTARPAVADTRVYVPLGTPRAIVETPPRPTSRLDRRRPPLGWRSVRRGPGPRATATHGPSRLGHWAHRRRNGFYSVEGYWREAPRPLHGGSLTNGWGSFSWEIRFPTPAKEPRLAQLPGADQRPSSPSPSWSLLRSPSSSRERKCFRKRLCADLPAQGAAALDRMAIMESRVAARPRALIEQVVRVIEGVRIVCTPSLNARRDSNPDTMVQSHVSYRWTTSQRTQPLSLVEPPRDFNARAY